VLGRFSPLLTVRIWIDLAVRFKSSLHPPKMRSKLIITDRPDLQREMIKKLWQPYQIEKNLPHATELIYCLTKSYWDRTDSLDPTDDEIMQWLCGVGLEEVMTQSDTPESRPPVEGIYYTPDFQVFGYTSEIKTTRMSVKRGESRDFPPGWMKQIKAYCYGEKLTEYLLIVAFLMGNYRPPFPRLRVYHLEFTEQEIADNWEWMQMRKDIYMIAIENDIVPTPKMFNEEWECQYCRYKLRCDVSE